MTLSSLDLENSGTIVYQGLAGFLIPTVEEPGRTWGVDTGILCGYGSRAEMFRVLGCWGFLKDMAIRTRCGNPARVKGAWKGVGACQNAAPAPNQLHVEIIFGMAYEQPADTAI